MEKISKLKRKVINIPIIRNGANGISVFMPIFFLDKNMMSRLTTVPIQNDNITEANPAIKPNSHPIPRINLPSPKPISRPFEKSQSKAKGRAIIGPAIILEKVGNVKNEPIPE
jgi:hypothetical protein